MAPGATSGTHSLFADETRNGNTSVQVSTLDTALPEAHVHVLLVDTEGHEINVLRGAVNLIERCRPATVLEHHGREADLVPWLSERGYAVERVKGRLMAVAR